MGGQVTKSGPGSQTMLPPEGSGPLNKGWEGAGARALPDVSGGGERHDRFDVVVGERVAEPRIEGRLARRVGARNARAPPPSRARDGAGCAQ